MKKYTPTILKSFVKQVFFGLIFIPYICYHEYLSPPIKGNKLGLSCAKLMLSLTCYLDMLGLLSPGWIIFNVLNFEFK